VVAVDVIRATTMAVTAASAGHRCFPVDSLESAMNLSWKLHNPILAGEMKGNLPPGFDLNNSPVELLAIGDPSRPVIMLSSSGTRLIVKATGSDFVYLACFRNAAATAYRLLLENHSRIAIIGAGSRGEFREEDQICCAWIAARLLRGGYILEGEKTLDVVTRWANAKAEDCLVSHSVDYLRRTGQLADLGFILSRVDDLAATALFRSGEVELSAPHILPPRLPLRIAAS
jgi:2-phosphosulfolactate phosphatase